MASRVVEEKIIKLSIDDRTLETGLRRATDNIKNFDKAVDGVKGTAIDKLGASFDTVTSAVGSFMQKIPIVGSLFKTTSSEISSNADRASNAIEDIGGSTEQAASKFSLLSSAASYALGNVIYDLGTKAMNAIKSFTLDPVIGGFKEYEQELESTRVLMSALGDDALPDIIKTMATLEDYAGTTRYNVQTMNMALSQLVNAGIDLESSQAAIVGFGNLAASAGASTGGYTNALLYGLQQALQKGVMMTQDWKSIEGANMGSMMFKELLMDIGREQGKFDESLEEMGFRDSLSKKWLDNEVMLEALNRLAKDEKLLELAENLYTFGEAMEAVGEQVNNTWSKIWRNIFGEGKKTAEIWTPVGEALSGVLDFPGQIAYGLSKAFAVLDGRVPLFELVASIWSDLSDIVSSVGDAFVEVFPSFGQLLDYSQEFGDEFSDVNQLFMDIVGGIVDWIAGLKDALKVSDGVKESFYRIGLVIFDAFKGSIEVVKLLAKIFEILIPDRLITNAITLVGILATLGRTIYNIFLSFIDLSGWDRLMSAVDGLAEAFDKFWYSVSNILENFLFAIGYYGDKAADGVGKLGNKFDIFAPITLVVKALTKAFESLSWVINKISDAFDHLSIKSRLIYFFDRLGKNQAVVAVMNAIGTAVQFVKDGFSALGDIVGKVMGVLVGALSLLGSTIATALSKINFSVIVDGFSRLASTVIPILKTVATALGVVLTGVAVALYEAGRRVVEFFAGLNYTPLIGMVKTLYNETVKLFNRIKTAVAESPLGKFIGDIMEKLKTLKGIDPFSSKFITKMRAIVSESSFLSKAMGAVSKAVSAIGAAIKGGIKHFNEYRRESGLLVAIFKTLGDALGWVRDGFVKMFNAIKESETFKRFVQWLKDSYKELEGPIKTIFKFLQEVALKVFEEVGNAVKTLASYLGSESDGIVSNIKNIFETLMSYTMNSENITGPFSRILDFFQGLGGIFSEALSLLTGATKDLDINKVLGFASAFSLFKGLTNFKGINIGLFTGLEDVIGPLGETLEAFQKKVKADALLGIAKAIGIVTLSLIGLSLIPSDKVKQVIELLGYVSSAIVGVYSAIRLVDMLTGKGGPSASTTAGGSAIEGILSGVINKLGIPEAKKLMKKMGQAAMVMSLVYGVVKIVQAIQALAGMDLDTIYSRLQVVGLIFTALLGGSILGSFFEVKFGTAATYVMLALAISMIVGVIQKVASIPENILNDGMIRITMIGGFLSLAVGLISGEISFGGTTIKAGRASFGTALTLGALVLGIVYIAKRIEEIAKIKTSTLLKGMTVISAIGTVLGTLTKIIDSNFTAKGLRVKSGQATLKTVLVMATLIIGIVVLGKEVAKLGSLNLATIWKGVGVITVIGLLISAMTMVMGMDVKGKGFRIKTGVMGSTVLGMITVIGALIILSLASYGLGNLNQSKLWTGVAVITVIGVLMGAIMFVAGKYGTKKTIEVAGLVAATVGIVTVGLSLAILATLPIANILTATLAMGVIVAEMMLLIVSASTMDSWAGVVSLAAVAVAIVGVGYGLQPLATMDWTQLLAAVVLMGEVIGLIAVIGITLTGLQALGLGWALPLTLAAIGVAGIGLGVGMKYAAEGIEILYNVFMRFVLFLSTVVEEILGALNLLPESFGTAIDNIQAFIEGDLERGFANTGTEAGEQVTNNVVEGATTAADQNGGKVSDSLSNAIGSGLVNAFDTISKNFDLDSVISNFLNGDVIEPTTEKLTSGFTEQLPGFGTEAAPAYQEGLKNMVNLEGVDLTELLGSDVLSQDIMTNLSANMDANGNIPASTFQQILNSSGANVDLTQFGITGGSSSQEYAGGMLAEQTSVLDAAGIIANDSNEELGSADTGQTGRDSIKEFANELGGEFAKGLIDAAMSEIKDAILGPLSSETFLASLGSSGSTVVSTIAGGITGASGAGGVLQASLGKVADLIKGAFPNSPAKWGPLSGAGYRALNKAGHVIVGEVSDGIGAAKGSLSDSITDTLSVISDGLSDIDSYQDTNIVPVITPQVDMQGLQNLEGILNLADTRMAVQFDYSDLNAYTRQLSNQNDAISSLYKGIESLYDTTNDLLAATERQTDIVAQGRIVNTHLDGNLVSKGLASRMSGAIDAYKASNNRRMGIQNKL